MQINAPDIEHIIHGNTEQLSQLLDAVAGLEAGNSSADSLVALPEIFFTELHDKLVSGPELAELPIFIEQLLGNHELPLQPSLSLRLEFAYKIFSHILTNIKLDPALNNISLGLFSVFLRAAQDDENIYCNKTHALHRLINDICEFGVSWYPQQGKLSRKFPEKLEATISKLSHIDIKDYQALNEQQQTFRKFVTSEQKRAATVEKRTCESEAGAIKIFSAQKTVTEHLNQSLAGRIMPEAASSFLLGPWKEELQFILINQGPEAETWHQWQQLLNTFSWIFSADSDSTNKQQLFNETPSIISFLEKPAKPNTCSPEDYQTFAEQLSQALFQRLQGHEPSGEAVQPLIRNNELTGIETHVSQSLLKKADLLSIGDWFLFTNLEEQDIRCKLALKIPNTDQLLFVNRSGHKVLQKSIEEFALCLPSKIARPLVPPPFFERDPFDSALTDTINQLFHQHTNKLAAAKQQKAEKDKQLKEQQKKETQKKQLERDALARVKQAAALKAQQEAAALAELQKAQQQKAANESLDKLHVGTWVEIPSTNDEPVRAKLAVHIKSSGKYIFVDRLGTKVAEYLRPELSALFQTGKARIFKQGENFDDQLAKVIRGLRKESN